MLHHRIQLIFALAIMLWLLIFLAVSHAGERIVIMTDPGGVIAEYAARIIRYKKEGTRVEIRGTCNSACTLYLGLPNVCVAPNAWLGFHSSSNANKDETAAKSWNIFLMNHYPKSVRNALQPLSGELQFIRGSQISDITKC